MKYPKVKWPKIMNYNDLDQPPLIAWIDLGNATMFRISAFFCHGGNKRPRPGLMVAIERVGSFFFSLDLKVDYGYVSEKLFVPEPDARALADWINVQLGFECEQQGIYSRDYILGVEPYGLGGERRLMPLVPEITE